MKEFDKRYGFQNNEVLRLELEGNNYIKEIMTLLWKAISKSDGSSDKRNAYERYAYGTISENYQRVYEGSSKDAYCKQRLLCDAVSGMTAKYLIKMYERHGICPLARGWWRRRARRWSHRLKRSGMRWRHAGGQAILTLRALIRSRRFDSAWEMLSGTYRREVTIPDNVRFLVNGRRDGSG